jgi:glutathione S-transferase
MKLYSHALAPNPRRVRIFAAEKGIELALQDIDILAGQSRTPEFPAKNFGRHKNSFGARQLDPLA